jgi:protein-tyrosine kinase
VYAGLKPEKHIDDVVKTGDSMDKAMCQVEESSLYVMPLFQHTIMTPRTLEATKHDGFWEPLKEKFDLIIVDAPPAMMFPDGPGIVPHVDGVILVVEAEKTRWQVALEVKNKITRQGGNILGIVFNRRNYYIPRWLYKRV